MVHVRLNEREANPNPHVNFISPLAMGDAGTEEEARQLLRALAAQVRPVMKAHGFSVNSLEEYEWNTVFAGRNWNGGDTVELVLRTRDGFFQPTSWLLSTLCHELAHIKHMNHGPAFQALWAKLRNEVRTLQSQGYYGDGYWSSGTRLADSRRIAGDGIEAGDFPEYICGGAQTRQRPSRRRRRRRPSHAGPSSSTGAQVTKKRKAGSRVRAADAFRGEGAALNDAEGEKKGAGFRKQAQSKRAREERALAAEKRLRALQSSSSNAESKPKASSEDEEDDSDFEVVEETDQERRQTMHDAAQASDLNELKSGKLWTSFRDAFIFPEDTGGRCETPSGGSSTFVSGSQSGPSSSSTGKAKELHSGKASDPLSLSKPPKSSLSRPAKASSTLRSDRLGIGHLVQSEMQFRKKEALGLTVGGRALGSVPRGSQLKVPASNGGGNEGGTWACQVCTLENKALHLACDACGTPKKS